MRYLPFFLILFLVGVIVKPAQAQYASQMDAAYLATLKAVADYKINDEENLDEVEELRQDEKFNKKLRKMLNKLDNRKSKNSENKRVYEILKKAGRDIYNELK